MHLSKENSYKIKKTVRSLRPESPYSISDLWDYVYVAENGFD